MQLTKGAIGNLINRYKAVLKKCHLLNVFGSLAVAGMLVMGGAGMATAAGDMALGGGSLEWSGDADHLMGGNLYKGNVTVPEVTTPGDISLSIKGGTIEEIIGGSYVSGNNDQVGNVTLGNISTTIQDGSSTEFVVGGSKISNDVNATLATGKTSLTINGGTFGKEGENDGYELVMGGNYVKTGTDTKNTASAEGSRVTVNDGIFHASVVGGSVAHRYNGNNSIMVEDNGSTSVVIKGGTFSPSQSNIADNNGGINLTAAVIGGGLAYGGGSSVLGSRDNPVTSSVTINGGTFKPEANGHYAKIVAGSVVANNGGTAIVHGNTTLAMAGGTAHDDLIGGGMVENAATLSKESTSEHNLNITGDSSVKVTGGEALGEVIGGNYVKTSTSRVNSAKVANSSVTITGGTFANVDDSTNKAQYIIGGSKTNASGTGNATTLVEGNSSVLIDGDVTIEDGALIGGSQAKAGNGQSEATATVTGNSSVTVNKGTLAGVIGGGIAETYYTTAIAKSTVDGTSSVTINGGNVTGNSIETGAVAGNTGKLSAAVVGGGLANTTGSTATVGSTSVTIATGTINGKVVAGGAAVNGGSSTVTHDTSLTMTGGKVDGDLIGGGFVDMNNATDNEANVGGSTYITVSGGSLVDAEIIGGGSVRNATGEANVTGDTHVTVTKYANDQVDQQWVQYVLGGGKAMTSKNGQTATAKVAGSTNVTIGEQGATGEALKIEFGTVAGGGLARAQAASSTATANVNNANVTVHSGILSGVAGGGIAESYSNGTADATVTGAANLTINGGTINGVEYKGVDTNKVKVAVLGGGIAKGTGANATTTTTNTVINGGSIAGHVVAGGLADGGTATMGTANVTNANLTINGGEINGSVYAGGAALNSGTATVENFDVRITGGNITGDVVAGDYTGETPETKAVVLKTSPSKGTAGKGGTITIGGDATIGGKVDASAGGVATNVVIDGADATVTGGYEGNKDSTLTFNNYNDKFDNAAYGFGTLNVAEGSNVRMDAVVSGKQGTAPEDPQTGFFGARHDAEGSSNPITITGGGTITAKQFHVSTNANVTIAHGNVVADDVQVQSATLKVGGESTSASLTVNEELIIDKTHPGNQNIDVENLGTLTLGKNIVLDENGKLKAEALDTIPTHVKAGGTLKVNGLDGKTLTDKELASLQGLLNSNIPDIPPGEGLLDLGGADLGEAVTPDPDGTVNYDKVQGITTNSLKDTTVTVNDEQNAAGISGGFQAVKLTEDDTELNAKGTLVLAGSQNGDNLVINKDGAVADLRVGGAYTARDTSAVTLGLADANNSGTVETVTLNAGTDNKATLNVIGAGAAEFNVGDIRANESTNTINVAGATLNTGNITTESGTKALDELNITSGIVNALGNVNITDVALANGVLTANEVPATAEGVPATGDITLGTLSGQGAVVADNALTVTNDYNGADTDALGLQADTLTTANFDSTKGDVTIKASQWNASGTTTLKGDAVELTKAGTFTGAFAMDGGTLVAQSGDDANLATLTFQNNATFTNGAVAVVDSIKMDGANKTLTVGTGDDKVGGTTLSAQHIDLNGGMLLVDPAWGLPSSNVAVASLSETASETDVTVKGSVGVGQNSYLALGTADTGWLPGVVGNYTKGVGLSQDGITAALGVFKGITIADTKGLVVDGSLMGTANGEPLYNAVSAAANTATFGANSLLVVNGANIYGDKAAITFDATGGGKLTVDNTSRLVVTDAVAGETYTIVDKVTTVQDGTSTPIANGGTVWKTEGLSTTTDMISLDDAVFTPGSTGAAGTVTTSAKRNDAATVFPNLSDGMANAVNDLYTGHDGAAGEPRWDYADVDSADMGVRFLSRATDNHFLGADKDAAAATIESAARIAFAGAVPQMTKMASDAGSNAVVNRLGFANPADGAQAMDAEGKIVDRNTTGFALWIAPLWQSQHGWGMEADNLDYGFNGNLGGVSLGADYTFENAIRAGITFNIGGGYAESSGGDLNSTENRMSFWGLGAYAGWNYENFGLMADVSYTSTWNDLKQDMDSRMGMGDLEADVQASAISAGLRAEYKLETSVLDVIPHIGVRYMSLNTWGFDAESNGGTVLEGDGFHQDIWTFPVGVTFTKDFTLDSGWSFKPSIDFSVIPAAGDIKAKQDVAFTGLPGSYEVETQMMDYLTWQGGVGLEMGNDTMSFGVNYTLQAGQHTTGHGVFGSFRYEF